MPPSRDRKNNAAKEAEEEGAEEGAEEDAAREAMEMNARAETGSDPQINPAPIPPS